MYASAKSMGLIGLETYVVSAEADVGGEKFNFESEKCEVFNRKNVRFLIREM